MIPFLLDLHTIFTDDLEKVSSFLTPIYFVVAPLNKVDLTAPSPRLGIIPRKSSKSESYLSDNSSFLRTNDNDGDDDDD